MTGTVSLHVWQRVESLAIALVMLWLYHLNGASWWLFAALILVPDLTMAGYLAGPRTGALIYNLGHAYIGPGILALTGFAAGLSALIPIALVWAAHIAIDRALGYGLKSPSGFTETHLGRIGAAKVK